MAKNEKDLTNTIFGDLISAASTKQAEALELYLVRMVQMNDIQQDDLKNWVLEYYEPEMEIFDTYSQSDILSRFPTYSIRQKVRFRPKTAKELEQEQEWKDAL